MAVKRGKSQARRNGGSSGGLPGWAWLILGIVITLVVILAAPRLLKPDGADGFIRPRPNPDAHPAASRGDEDDAVVQAPERGNGRDGAKPAKGADASPQYDFYTLLPGQEVVMSDAELAASARAEEARQQKLAQQQQRAQDAANAANPATAASAGAQSPAASAAPVATPTTGATPTVVATASPPGDNQAHYILQAGSFGGSGDAETLKARIALLGLNARVESADINGRTVYRVRMGPYGSATELADAKGKLANGGLPAMAIKAK